MSRKQSLNEFKSYEIREVPICVICGEVIKQYAVSSTFEAYGRCNCGNVWRGRSTMSGTAMMDKWRRVESE